MIKLAIVVAGITFTIFCSLMTLRSRAGNNSRFRNSNQVPLINDIKEIFGLPPIGSAHSLLSGQTSSGSGYSSSGGGGGAYLPPNSFRSDITSENNRTDSKPELTTPLFRIFIASTRPPTTPSSSTTSTTTEALTEESLSEMEETTTLPSNSDPIDDNPINIAFNSENHVMNFDLMGRGEITTNISYTVMPPPPPMKPNTPATTLQPPSVEVENSTLAPNVTENTINTETNSSPLSNNGTIPSSKLRTDFTPPPTGLYLPPNKEYLPPKQ